MDSRHDKVGFLLCLFLYVQLVFERTRQYLKVTSTTLQPPVSGGGVAATPAAKEAEEAAVVEEGPTAVSAAAATTASFAKAANADEMLDMAQALSLPRDETDNKQKDGEDLVCQLSPEYFHIEENRLRTFASWPVTFIRPNVLARYGFYYVGKDDTVKCYFCRVEIGLWEPQDDVIQEHLRWSPYCPLLKKRPTNNVPLASNYLDAVPRPGYDECGIYVRENSYAENVNDRARVDLDRLSGDSWSGASELSVGTSGSGTSAGVGSGRELDGDHHGASDMVATGSWHGLHQDRASMTAAEWNSDVLMMGGDGDCLMRRPEYPNYAIEADRLKSYEEWPTSMKQKPQQLSDAGFFYTGKSDRVKCFSCGGGLKDWEQDDEPWEQHAIWYSNCHYLQLMKGREFIQKCNALKEAAGANGGAGPSSSSMSSCSSSSQPSTSGISSGASSLMSTSPASSCGFSSPVPGAGCEEDRTLRCSAYSSSSGSDEGEDEAASGGKICKICFVNEYNTAFLPCGHVVACAKCASSVNKCPICQQPFINVLRLYLS